MLELWVIDVQGGGSNCTEKRGENGCRVVTILAETEPFSPLFLPSRTLRGSDILPKQSANDGERG